MAVRRNSRRNEDAMGIRFQDPSERARAAEAEVLIEPEMQFYGYRTYRARDSESHIWTFSVTVKKLTPAEWDEVSGSGASFFNPAGRASRMRSGRWRRTPRVRIAC